MAAACWRCQTLKEKTSRTSVSDHVPPEEQEQCSVLYSVFRALLTVSSTQCSELYSVFRALLAILSVKVFYFSFIRVLNRPTCQ